MFLFIFEDGSFSKKETYNDEDLISVDNGTLDIINMEAEEFIFYGDWIKIEELS